MFRNIIGWFVPNRSKKSYRTLHKGRFDNSRRLRHEILEDRRMLATLTVNVNDDFADNIDNGLLTLREAIAVISGTFTPTAQNGDKVQIDTSIDPIGTNDKIVFDSTISGATITLTQGQLAITETVSILGEDPNGNPVDITIDGNNASRIFHIQSTQVTLDHLTLTRGNVQGDGGTINASSSILTISDSRFVENTADSQGGAIYVNHGRCGICKHR